MRPIYLLVPAAMLLGSCTTSLTALCDPDDTACIEAALAAEAAKSSDVAGDANRDHSDRNRRAFPDPIDDGVDLTEPEG